MSEQLWVVRAGEKARYVDDFLDGSYIAVGFSQLASDDLSAIAEIALKERVTTPAERTFAGQLAAFAYRMELGDLVLVPRLPKRRDYLVARVTGGYRHVTGAPASGHHQRPVQWLGTFDRHVLSPGAINTLGAIQTVFRPSAVEAELRALLTRLAPLEEASPSPGEGKVDGSQTTPSGPTRKLSTATASGPMAPAVVVTSARPFSRVQVDIEMDDRGRASIVCGHPALVMEQTPRHVDPDGQWAGVPGVYVLTGTDLEHAAVRTGPERTLTTTLIVKPWAYVGLSEDFQGRLGSHRQSKPEWRRALLVRSGAAPFASDDIKYLERKVHEVLAATGEVLLAQAPPRGNLSAQPRNPAHLDACADAVVAVLRLTGTLI